MKIISYLLKNPDSMNRDARKYVTTGFTFQFIGDVGFQFLGIGMVFVTSLYLITHLLFDSFKVLLWSLVLQYSTVY